MKFTIKNLLIVTLTVAVLLACTFALPPAIGGIGLTLISLFVLPPFIWVGVINLRGVGQAFLIGALITGIPHFILSTYTVLAIFIFSGGGFEQILDQDFPRSYSYFHLVSILLGCLGGFSGVVSYRLLCREKHD